MLILVGFSKDKSGNSRVRLSNKTGRKWASVQTNERGLETAHAYRATKKVSAIPADDQKKIIDEVRQYWKARGTVHEMMLACDAYDNPY